MSHSSYQFMFDLTDHTAQCLTDEAERLFDAVWRFDFAAPGFCLLDLGAGLTSRDLRSTMLILKNLLSKIGMGRGIERFAYRSIGRFNQHCTTKFHLDGAPDRSMLMLGYEPSKVRSRLSMADYTRSAHELGIEPRQFLDQFNPMYRKGEELLEKYVTELPEAAEGHSRIVLINNSSMPFSENRANPVGVLHKAEILEGDESEQRVVNSIVLTTGEGEELPHELLESFVATEAISGHVYG